MCLFPGGKRTGRGTYRPTRYNAKVMSGYNHTTYLPYLSALQVKVPPLPLYGL